MSHSENESSDRLAHFRDNDHVDATTGPPAGQITILILASLVLLLLSGLPAILVAATALFVFLDAWHAGIRRDAERRSFLNISPLGWGIGVLLMLVLVYPVYVLNRGKLKSKEGKPVLFVCVNAFGILVLALAAVGLALLLLGPSKPRSAQIRQLESHGAFSRSSDARPRSSTTMAKQTYDFKTGSISDQAVPPQPTGSGEVTVGQELEFSGPTLDGGHFDLKELRGKVVLVDFWASWCGPCIAELPNVRWVYDHYHQDGFEIVGVSLDKSRDNLVRSVASHNIPWRQIYFDEDGKRGWDNPIGRKYGIRSIPTMYLIDRDGKVMNTRARGHALEDAVALGLGKAPREKGDFDTYKLAQYTQKIESNPRDGEAYHQRGHQHEKRKQWKEAAADFSKAIEYLGGTEHLYLARANAYGQLKELELADEDFSKAIEFASDKAEAYHQRGHVREKMKQWDKAASDYAKASELRPSDQHLRLVLAEAYEMAGDHGRAREARAELEDLLGERRKTREQYTFLARKYLMAPEKFRDPEKALALAEEGLEHYPGFAKLVRMLGIAYYRLGQTERALETLERVVESRKSGGSAFEFFPMAMCCQALGLTDEARIYNEKAEDWWAKHPNMTEPANRELAVAKAEVDAMFAAERRP